ncbi:hypothetical protein ABOM_005778 [Aspergillus bombycis]|uniref:nitrilase n=1 Tax=Aspergillus bombycis TaxID=109264 RepID=A0A1F7ZZY8_9EURO|nr:hypothetical protein ABOM_005778 [Aspergillus bombycis]OGM45016.1 hypothetical protein ABOM_005778 [Aspergillus bombycis]
MGKTVRVGCVQAEPAWNDLEAGVNKVITIIEEASKNNTQVLGFPEVFIPGYPWCMFLNPPASNSDFFVKYLQNSMPVDSPQMRRIRAAVKQAGMFVVLGYSERHHGSMYISQAFIDPTGEIVLNRRKIKPTHIERAYWGTGQGESLQTVVPTEFGRIGALNCWEHTQPLLRYYEYEQNAEIHVASWPAMWDAKDSTDDKPFYQCSATMNQRLSQVVAFEGACVVLVCTQVMSETNAERNGITGWSHPQLPGGGFSMIYGADGAPLCNPLPPGEEGILYANVDLDEHLKAKQWIDVVGHYSRPELLSLRVNTHGARPVHHA